MLLNTAPAQKLSSEALSLCDIVVPNQGELSLLADMPTSESFPCSCRCDKSPHHALFYVPTDSHQERVAAAQVLLGRGARCVVCTLGGEGALLVSAELTQQFPLPEQCRGVTAVDTVGAGDCFVASLAFFLACGVDLVEAVGRANRVAALSVTKKGAQTSYPFSSELPGDLFEGCLLYRT